MNRATILRLLLTKIENHVKLEPTLSHCYDCTELSLPLTFFCPIAKSNDENKFITWYNTLNLNVRRIKANQENALLWDNGGAGGANFEFTNLTQVAKCKLFAEKKGLSSTKKFINAILKEPVFGTTVAEKENERLRKENKRLKKQ
jgi:hypothetical protein